ncbi:M48 family metallopeptidase [Octadecabacter sp. 1_MG-2023]|uniref:M48 family metallopeptidase n=1 Tax=unclassified Octadecabacter TaxID=196158 RepID=UPI001C09CD5D|nr:MULTISPECIES: M48 family metallopeptidase [unclassified Octadecabacter]MBU2994666.1 M48 family metallopeptidase [Octadecabacter sp. B2R22]MDO6734040.1 M48 family metallopeptidase [Octadecabacter sp. 1_MG-2023]
MQDFKFRVLTGLTLVVLGLAGCDAPTLLPSDKVATPSQASAPVAGPTVQLSREQRAMARSFVQVVNQLEPVAERECRRQTFNLNCDFLIVVDDRPNQPANAFQTVDDNGRPIIAFTLALIAEAQNEDEIAFVMAHEAAHHIENHLAQQQRNASLVAVVFGEWAGEAGGGVETVQTAQEIGAAIGARSYSKNFELEADRLGTIIAAQAGYDPVRGAEFFFRIPDPGDVFLGTHPPNAERVQMVLQTAASL